MYRRIENTTTIRDNKLSYFINIFSSKLIPKKGTFISSINEIHNLYKLIKSSENIKPSAYLNTFMDKATLRLALRDYVTGAKKTLIPKPVSKQKARLAFMKKLLDDYTLNRSEKQLYKKIHSEIHDFYSKRGLSYNNKNESYIIARQNIRQGRYVYK